MVAVPPRTAVIAALAAVAYTAAFGALWPDVPIADDGAIVLRYLDHFAAGEFYTYNTADGPVFGVSGFLHCVLAGALVAAGLASPEGALLASNTAGLALTAWFVLLLLARAAGGLPLALAPWLLTMTGASYLVVHTHQGLETPLQLAIVAAALLALRAGWRRALWPLLALAVIGKLDTAPVALALGGLALIAPPTGAGGERRPRRVRVAAEAVALGVAPLAAWAAFATAVFGSPLPRALTTRFAPGTTTEGAWFAFFETGFAWTEPLVLAWAAAAIVLVAWFTLRRTPGRALTALAPTWACLALLLTYRVAQPTEPMAWYFALPELLMLLQLATTVLTAARALDGERWLRPVAVVMTTAALLIPLLPRTLARARAQITYNDVVERERIEVGRFIAAHANSDQTLATGHGHIAREAALHTHDLSGLNSPEVATLIVAGADPIASLEPDWIAQHGPLDRQDYELQATFDAIERTTGWPAWHVYRRTYRF